MALIFDLSNHSPPTFLLRRDDAVHGRRVCARPEASAWEIEGFSAFWHGDYAAAIEQLHGARFIANGFGGSHAQRDIIDWTLTEAAIRGGMRNVAESLANERLALKPHSPVNRAFLEQANVRISHAMQLLFRT